MIRAKMLKPIYLVYLLYLFLFKLIYLRPIANQVIPTYINHSRPLISDGIHHFFFSFFLNEVWEEREARPVLICWAISKEASGTIFITSLVWRVALNTYVRTRTYSMVKGDKIFMMSLKDSFYENNRNELLCTILFRLHDQALYIVW